MVRTIYVVYTDQKLGYAQIRCMKQYMFLCPFDNIQAGDMIKDKRYSTAMQVLCTSRMHRMPRKQPNCCLMN